MLSCCTTICCLMTRENDTWFWQATERRVAIQTGNFIAFYRAVLLKISFMD